MKTLWALNSVMMIRADIDHRNWTLIWVPVKVRGQSGLPGLYYSWGQMPGMLPEVTLGMIITESWKYNCYICPRNWRLACDSIHVFIINFCTVKSWRGFCLRKREKSLPSPNGEYCHCLNFPRLPCQPGISFRDKKLKLNSFNVPADGQFRKPREIIDITNF